MLGGNMRTAMIIIPPISQVGFLDTSCLIRKSVRHIDIKRLIRNHRIEEICWGRKPRGKKTPIICGNHIALRLSKRTSVRYGDFPWTSKYDGSHKLARKSRKMN
jgi:hypothetical protein